MKFVMIALLALSASAFANEERDAAVIDATIKAAQTLAAADLSCAKSTDCQVISVGSKACGGPNGFMVASKKNANIKQIVSLAKRSESLEAAFNLRYSVFSTCDMEMAPIPKCVANVCQ